MEDIPWEELLDDLFAAVLNELDSPEVAWVCGVCSSWKSKARKLLHCIRYHLSDGFLFEELVQQFPVLKDVTVLFRGQHPELQQLYRVGALRQLQHLELRNTRSVLEFPFLDLSVLRISPKLSSLTIDGCHIEQQTGIQHLNLEALTLIRCAVELREPSLAALLQGMKKLKKLRIEHLAGGSIVQLRGISVLQQLRHLVLRVRSASQPTLMNEFGKMHGLKTLDVNLTLCPSPSTFEDVSLSSLTALTALEELNLGGHCHITDSGIKDLSRLTALTHLDLSAPTSFHLQTTLNFNGLTDRGLRHLLPLKKLCSLNLSFCKVSYRLLYMIVQRFGCLRRLSLSHCQHITDTILFNLDRCPYLTSLDISYCPHVTDVGLFGISKQATQLRVLNIDGCHHRLISVLGLRQLYHLKLLAWLSMAYCEQVTDDVVEQCINGTPYLKTLCLKGCYRITDRSVEVMRRALPYIKELDLSHCCHITNASVEKLLSMPCLRRVALNNTTVTTEYCHLLRRKGTTVHRETRWWMH